MLLVLGVLSILDICNMNFSWPQFGPLGVVPHASLALPALQPGNAVQTVSGTPLGLTLFVSLYVVYLFGPYSNFCWILYSVFSLFFFKAGKC